MVLDPNLQLVLNIWKRDLNIFGLSLNVVPRFSVGPPDNQNLASRLVSGQVVLLAVVS